MYYVEPRIRAFIFCRFVHWKPNGCLFGPALELFPLLYQSFTEHDAARYKILNKRLTSARAVSRVLCDSHLALVRREAPLLAPLWHWSCPARAIYALPAVFGAHHAHPN